MPENRFEFAIDAMDYSTWTTLEEFEWVEVRGGDLETPVHMRFARTEDGRFVLNGLILGAEFPRPEITANTLRRIPIAEISRQLWDSFSPDVIPSFEDSAKSVEWGLMHSFALRQDWIPERGKAANRAPATSELEQFAQVYLQERARNRRRAMTTTAERLHISRATANRRAKACREKGLLGE